MNVPSSQVILEQAKQAKRLNDLPRARNLLSQAIKTDPRNEDAWLLFADVAEKPEHAIYSLEQVLKINPVNMAAVDRLNALKNPDPAPHPVTSPLVSRSPAQPIAVPPVRQEPEREKVILEERMHGAVFILPFLIAAVGVVFAVVMNKMLGPTYAMIAVLGGALFVFEAALEFLKLLVRFATRRLTLTNKRIVIKYGLISRNTFEVLLTKVEGIGIKQPLLGRVVGFGTITVTGTGGAHQMFWGMRDPEEFRKRVQAEIAVSQSR